MGIIAIILPLLAIFLTQFVYQLPFPQSISETATIAWRTDWLLPFCLGALALFSLNYAIFYRYDLLDRILTLSMFVGFTLVAAQVCESPYINVERIGLFGVNQQWSHIIHCIGAIGGFGAMILWILLAFRKSDKPKAKQSIRKRMRNNIYFWLGIGMIASLLFFVVEMLGFLPELFPTVFWAEFAMLLFGGTACLFKGAAFLRDKKTQEDIDRWNFMHN